MKVFSKKNQKAFTLVELILTVGMVAVIGAATVGLVYSSYEDWELTSTRSEVMQDGRAAVVRIIRELRQTKQVRSVSGPGDNTGYVTFEDADGQIKEFRLNTGTNELEYGPEGDLRGMIGSVTKLVFTCYDADLNVLNDPVNIGSIQLLAVEGDFSDESGGSVSFTLSDQVFLPTDLQSSMVINEIMYHPPGGHEDKNEWIELYNNGNAEVDITGWMISIEEIKKDKGKGKKKGEKKEEEELIPHILFGGGMTIIPPGGYAVITCEDTDVYKELIKNGGFEKKTNKDWKMEDQWSRTKWNAQEGAWKLEKSEVGIGQLWQDIKVSKNLQSCLFVFWEMTTTSEENTNMTVTVRDKKDDDVLMQCYSGSMNSEWTCHMIDLVEFSDEEIRIHFEVNKTAAGGVVLLDTISVASSMVDAEAIRLSAGDKKIGKGLENKNGIITVTDKSEIVDIVEYDKSWGGDDDGTSLARIDPAGDSNDANNWQSGPDNGTPGRVNN